MNLDIKPGGIISWGDMSKGLSITLWTLLSQDGMKWNGVKKSTDTLFVLVLLKVSWEEDLEDREVFELFVVLVVLAADVAGVSNPATEGEQ